jgi:transcriptional regulator GlxA family with amidase domain
LERFRIEAAQRLLETSSLSIDEITAAVGYEDSRSFRRLFRSVASGFTQ